MMRRRSLLLASSGVAASVLWVRTAVATPEAMQAAVLRFTGSCWQQRIEVVVTLAACVEGG